MAVKQVAVVAFDGISSFHLSIPCVVFKDAFFDGVSPFELKVCAEKPGKLPVSSGFDIYVEHGLNILAQADLIIIPSTDITQPPAKKLLSYLRKAHEQGAIIVGLCVGAYVLAEAGLLDNKTATTHWAYAEQFRTRFAQVNLDAEPLFIEQDRIITSAGTAAALDCCLYILRQLCGAQLASEVARKLVTAPFRSGGQKQYIELPLPEKSSDQRISQMMSDVLADLNRDYTIDQVAQRCAMSRRHFSRVFKQLVGSSFVGWLTTARLKYAQELLEFSNTAIALIAEQAGFRSEENFRKQFKQVFQVSPSRWRSTFCKQESDMNTNEVTAGFDEAQALAALLSHLQVQPEQVQWISPEFDDQKCTLTRLDDNNNTIVMKTFNNFVTAELTRVQFERRGHKQVYEVIKEK